MKRKEKERKRSLSVGELRAELTQLRAKRFKLQFKHRVTPLQNPLELRAVRRNIARLQTWIRKRELETNKE
ncbi:MAG: 50S ribosomal protein L29 [Elusimicrobiota bacterium]